LKFSFLHNFRVVNNPLSNSPFITNKFNFEKIGLLIWISKGFDGSVNIIFTDDKNNPGIINSRFKRIDSSRLVSIADRTGDSNIYSDDDWDRVALIQNTNYPVKVVDAFGEETLRYWKGLLKRRIPLLF
jgi:hypothetical protein